MQAFFCWDTPRLHRSLKTIEKISLTFGAEEKVER
jgi:hypothetical protein